MIEFIFLSVIFGIAYFVLWGAWRDLVPAGCDKHSFFTDICSDCHRAYLERHIKLQSEDDIR